VERRKILWKEVIVRWEAALVDPADDGGQPRRMFQAMYAGDAPFSLQARASKAGVAGC
jgi:hypothetical protein